MTAMIRQIAGDAAPLDPVRACLEADDCLRIAYGAAARMERPGPAGRGWSTVTLADMQDAVPCVTPGTMIATDRGPRPAAAMRAGDRVMTADCGVQTLISVTSHDFGWRSLGLNPMLRPVLIRRGSLGADLPAADLVVSPSHRMMSAGPDAAGRTLTPVHDMVGRPGISVLSTLAVRYIEFGFASEQMFLSEGAWGACRRQPSGMPGRPATVVESEMAAAAA